MIEKGIPRVIAVLSATAWLTGPVGAEPRTCPGGQVLTEGAGTDAALICELALRVRGQLASCNLTVPAPLTIEIVPDLAENCAGLYHCGESRIELLPPALYVARQDARGFLAFRPISTDAIFESLMRHEMAHAALDDTPCPFSSCVVTQEYVAYTMQILFLPEADRALFTAGAPEPGTVSADMLHPMILVMAPDLFARRAWRHLMDQDDPCDVIGRIADGQVTLDSPQW
ncbi:hypothetical protein HKCCSP123_12580 [Rhodobacterales bacterium HKCCSP123]|nr:hypothetical protein [Rhodobacterales bacterium HKCCSP123]